MILYLILSENHSNFKSKRRVKSLLLYMVELIDDVEQDDFQ